ncbi:MAG: glycosyltransferase family 4 protein [Rhizobiaceae bacterium]|nr:glycosyltransferase family 4 protein [Rhizobiaceae bacterium]MCV0405280.1 glycosyltransferase family 4 protein [Rhizobiaceae bacterium]
MRIVHCFRSPVGGIFRHVRDLARAQVAAGHAVGIICDSSTGGAFEGRLFDDLAPILALGVHRTPMQRHIGIGDLASAVRTYRLIKGLKPDIVHGHGAKGGVYARLFGTVSGARRHRVARLYSPHGGSLHYDAETIVGRLFFALESLMSRFTDQLLFVSDYERRTYREKVGEPRCPASLVYNGLADPEFEPVETAPNGADFLYIGMMRGLKGPDLFIEALALAERELGRPLSAVMVGDGDELGDYRHRVEELGLADRVRFHPPMPAREAFRLARCVVVPSRAEAMPYIVLETLAAAKPMIATSVGGIPEIFGDTAEILVRPDAAQLTGRMVEAASDFEAYEARMPDRETLKARFGVDAMARGIDAAYRDALTLRRGGSYKSDMSA